MIFDVDEKGKYFTDVIRKDAFLSEIQTLTHRIRGYVYVRKGDRFTDEINRSENFMAITKAEILTPDGQVVFSSDFLVVNRAQIVWLMPLEDRHDMPE
jgi:hypothetical protein